MTVADAQRIALDLTADARLTERERPRVLVGIALLALVVFGPKTYWGLVGLVPLVTGLLGSCPLYALLGISTCRTSRHGTRAAGTSTGGARI